MARPLLRVVSNLTRSKEHEQILQAIEGRAVSQARQAMQHHLLNSRQRYQKLAGEHGPQ